MFLAYWWKMPKVCILISEDVIMFGATSKYFMQPPPTPPWYNGAVLQTTEEWHVLSAIVGPGPIRSVAGVLLSAKLSNCGLLLCESREMSLHPEACQPDGQ